MAETLFCSFCGKSQHDVRKLIAGPKAFICNECVTLCLGILTELDKPKEPDLDAIRSIVAEEVKRQQPKPAERLTWRERFSGRRAREW